MRAEQLAVSVLLVVLCVLVITPSDVACDEATRAGAVQIPFTEHVVDDGFDGAKYAYATDLDGDNDTDILGAAGFARSIAWWENDGLGHFAKYTITDSFVGAYAVYPIDLDGDSDVDVIGAADYPDQIAWWKNDGDQSFTGYSIESDFPGACSVHALDLDGDLDIDIVGAAYGADEIAWWENDGTQSFTKHALDTSFGQAFSVFAIDLDTDGDADVLGAAAGDDQIAWWENEGNHTFSKHVIDSAFDGAHSVFATDVNGDGFIDVLGAADSGDEIAWWENDGSQHFIRRTISSSFDGARVVYATDLEGDDDVDVLGVAFYADKIAWWENDGNEGFTEHTLASGLDWVMSVHGGDIDGDNDFDVVGAVHHLHSIIWWEQGSQVYASFLPLILKNGGPPEAPVLAGISNPSGDYGFEVSWSAAARADSYTLQQSDEESFSTAVQVYSGDETSTTVSVASTGTFYYRVAASNEFGSSVWSNTQSVVVVIEPPPCPQAGSWAGASGYPSFTVVHTPRCQVESLRMKYSFICADLTLGGGTVSFGSSFPVDDNHFEVHTSSFDVVADFTSPATAEAEWTYSDYDFQHGWCSGSGTWTAEYGP